MEGESNQAEKKVLNLNGLFYQVPPPLSTTLNRTYKKNYSQRTEYGPGDTIVFDMNVSGFVDPELAFIKFTVEAVGQNSNFGARQSVANLFREIRIQSKNGAELDRIEHANDWINHYLLACEDGRKPEEYGLNWGHGGSNQVAGQQYTYTFPLYLMTGLFRPYVKGQKIPPQILSGSRIEIQLESSAKALISTTGGSYKVIKPEIVLMEHALNDNSNKIIVEQSANNGLEYVYPRVFSVVENSTASEFNTQVKKAVSQACACYVLPKLTGAQGDITQNSFITLNGTGNFQQFQVRVGSNYYPHQSIEDLSTAHEISSLVCGKRHKQSPLITSNSYRNVGEFHMSVPLKKEHDISASGLAINNSAALEVRYVSGNTTDKTIYIFMEYICLARSFLSQTSVKI